MNYEVKTFAQGYAVGYTLRKQEQQNKDKEINHWITRIHDGENFWGSDRYSVWGITDRVHSIIEKSVKPGDIIWFVKNKTNGGNIVAFAVYQQLIKRRDGSKLGELSNVDFGWKETGWTSNYLLKYKSRINIEVEEKIQLELNGASALRNSKAKKTADMLERINVDLCELYHKYT